MATGIAGIGLYEPNANPHLNDMCVIIKKEKVILYSGRQGNSTHKMGMQIPYGIPSEA